MTAAHNAAMTASEPVIDSLSVKTIRMLAINASTIKRPSNHGAVDRLERRESAARPFEVVMIVNLPAVSAFGPQAGAEFLR